MMIPLLHVDSAFFSLKEKQWLILIKFQMPIVQVGWKEEDRSSNEEQRVRFRAMGAQNLDTWHGKQGSFLCLCCHKKNCHWLPKTVRYVW